MIRCHQERGAIGCVQVCWQGDWRLMGLPLLGAAGLAMTGGEYLPAMLGQ